ncbi:hypothetical protein F7725_001778, partial [Dissostichus mawsoni]
TEAKKSRPCWQLVPATCSVREAELGAPAVKVSLHRGANGHLKLTSIMRNTSSHLSQNIWSICRSSSTNIYPGSLK